MLSLTLYGQWFYEDASDKITHNSCQKWFCKQAGEKNAQQMGEIVL